jgi:hypothetical protein
MSDAPRRIQRQNVKGWRMPPNTVFVGRPSRWANPFRVAKPEWSEDVVVALFSELCVPEWTRTGAIASLRGRNLACWCRLDQPCHADVLLQLANAPLQEKDHFGLEGDGDE